MPTDQSAAGGYCETKSFAMESDLPKSAMVCSMTDISIARSAESGRLASD